VTVDADTKVRGMLKAIQLPQEVLDGSFTPELWVEETHEALLAVLARLPDGHPGNASNQAGYAFRDRLTVTNRG
jgi:hypothetical protein